MSSLMRLGQVISRAASHTRSSCHPVLGIMSTVTSPRRSPYCTRSPNTRLVYHNPTAKYIAATYAGSIIGVLSACSITAQTYMKYMQFTAESDELFLSGIVGAFGIGMFLFMTRLLRLYPSSIHFSDESRKFYVDIFGLFLTKHTIEFGPGEAEKLDDHKLLFPRNVKVKDCELILIKEHFKSPPHYHLMFEENKGEE